jgi:hypothetical protein
MGQGWGGTLGQGRAKSQRATLHASPKSLLFMPFRVIPWRIVATLARPVTPEVAGSSPVAPVQERLATKPFLDQAPNLPLRRMGSAWGRWIA